MNFNCLGYDLDDSIRSKLAGSRALVTGGAGAIGSNTVHALLGLDCEVTVLDDFSSGYLDNLADVASAITLVRGDVDSDASVAEAFSRDPHYVFHLAAHFANQNSIDHPLEDCRSNANGTIHVLEHCKAARSLKRFVYASSSCVLGHSDEIMVEETPFATDTPYAVSKLAGELYTQIYHKVFGIPTSVVRYFNVYGPGERPGPYRNVLPNFVQRAIWGQPLVITGTGVESREFVFVEDAVHGTLLAATADAALGQVFHIGSGAVRTIRELAESVVAATGHEVPIEYKARRHWDTILTRQTSFAKAQRLLGYEPRIPFETGLARTVDWIRALALPAPASQPELSGGAAIAGQVVER